MSFDFVKNEHEILKFWEKENVFAKMAAKNAQSKQRYRTLDGPITANGSMCIHHVWGRTFKDAMIKYNTLRGRSAQFQNGFDAQGMWVEVEVEKLLGLNDKKAISDYGLANFTEKCIERVNFFAELQTRQSIRLGQIMDWENSYFTNSDHNIESIWHFLKICNERGLLAKSYKSMPWCPRCGTSLSEHEMAGSYRELTHKAVFVKEKIKNTNLKILIWTTTPWTLPANVAVAVNPEHKYLKVKVKSDGDLLVVGKEALKVLGKDVIEVVEEFPGSELVGLSYEPALALKVQQFDHKIIPWNEVSATDGSGVVHIAPGCGAEDFDLGQKLGLQPIVPINDAGIFTDEFEWLAGLSTEKAEAIIFDKLTEHGTMYRTHDFKHNYPYCWRCKTNVVFKLVDGWDIKTDPVKPALFRAVREDVTWQPEFLQKSMENWLENMGDWNISRRRFYGLPLPIYECGCGRVTVVGSKVELKTLAVNPGLVEKIPHLHRPYIDEIQIKCPNCAKAVSRVPEVGDCWLDAGIAPFSTKKYFTDKKFFEQNFPSEAVIEMKEQIRLWFYAQLFMSVVLMDRAPYERVVGYGTILDEDGKKFSKTGPKNIKFDDAAEQFGADVMRYTFCGGNPANDVRFGPNLADEARRKMLSLWNTFTFFNTYASIDKPSLVNYTPNNLDVTDVWLVETLNKYIKDCGASYDAYKLHEVISNTEAFVEDLSNFYIRINRRRFWKSENEGDKLNAYWSLYNAIKSITIVMSPITPFLCEYIWQNLVRVIEPAAPALVVIADFPKPLKYKGSIKNIIERVEFIKKVIGLALRLRASEQLKVKQPLRTMFIKATGEHRETLELFANVLKDELNVKTIEQVFDDNKFTFPYLTVNFKNAGMVLKNKVQRLKEVLEGLDEKQMNQAVDQFEKGEISIGEFQGLPCNLFERKLKGKPQFVSADEADITVVLDTTLDKQLIEEGRLRELIRSIQVARAEAKLDITARVVLWLGVNQELSAIVEKNGPKICSEVLATEINIINTNDDEVSIIFK